MSVTLGARAERTAGFLQCWPHWLLPRNASVSRSHTAASRALRAPGRDVSAGSSVPPGGWRTTGVPSLLYSHCGASMQDLCLSSRSHAINCIPQYVLAQPVFYMLDCTIVFLLSGAFLGRESEHDASLSGFPWLISIICCSSHFGLLIEIDAFCFGSHFLASWLQQPFFRFYFHDVSHSPDKQIFKCLYHFISVK